MYFYFTNGRICSLVWTCHFVCIHVLSMQTNHQRVFFQWLAVNTNSANVFSVKYLLWNFVVYSGTTVEFAWMVHKPHQLKVLAPLHKSRAMAPRCNGNHGFLHCRVLSIQNRIKNGKLYLKTPFIEFSSGSEG